MEIIDNTFGTIKIALIQGATGTYDDSAIRSAISDETLNRQRADYNIDARISSEVSTLNTKINTDVAEAVNDYNSKITALITEWDLQGGKANGRNVLYSGAVGSNKTLKAPLSSFDRVVFYFQNLSTETNLTIGSYTVPNAIKPCTLAVVDFEGTSIFETSAKHHILALSGSGAWNDGALPLSVVQDDEQFITSAQLNTATTFSVSGTGTVTVVGYYDKTIEEETGITGLYLDEYGGLHCG